MNMTLIFTQRKFSVYKDRKYYVIKFGLLTQNIQFVFFPST